MSITTDDRGSSVNSSLPVHGTTRSFCGSLSHMGSMFSKEQITTKNEPASSLSPKPSTSFSRPEIPKELDAFIPEDTFSMLEDKPSSSSSCQESKRRKKSFVYMINGQPLNKIGKKCSTSTVRSRHNSDSSAFTSRGNSGTTSAPLEITPYNLPPTHMMRPRIDFFPVHSNQFESSFISGSLLHHASLVGMGGPNPFVPFVAPSGVFPPLMPPIDPDEPTTQPMGGAKKKKPQRCRLCANHDVYALVKGHKLNCQYRHCTCRECCITKERQVAVRQQAQQTRHQESQRNHQHQEHQDGFHLNFHLQQQDLYEGKFLEKLRCDQYEPSISASTSSGSRSQIFPETSIPIRPPFYDYSDDEGDDNIDV